MSQPRIYQLSPEFMKKQFKKYRRDILEAEKGPVFEKGSALRIALGYPNSYEVGIANLGFQTVYRLFNQEKAVWCERFFFERKLEAVTARTLESGRSIAGFDIVAFSISYELDLVNLLRLLRMAEIPLDAENRGDERYPFVMAGGVAPTLNPEPFAPFFDLIFVGEAEAFIPDFVRVFREKSRQDRERLLVELSALEGVYVPRFYAVQFDQGGKQISVAARDGVPQRVRRRIYSDIYSHPAYSPVLSMLGHFKDTLLIEVGRGCPHRCKFCAAAPIYSPTRFSSAESILSTVENHSRGASKVGLVGTLLSDYPVLTGVCRSIVEGGFGLGLSSFRADRIDPQVLRFLRRSGERTLTIAPEVGEERLRFTIGKQIKNQEILRGVRLANRVGLRNLRLYFMIGVPGESMEDLRAIVELVSQIKKELFRGNVRISLAPLVPKPWTPFMYAAYPPKEELERKLKFLDRTLSRLPGVSLHPQGLRSSAISALISLGSRRVGEALADFATAGRSLRSALRSKGVAPESLLHSERSAQDFFPWDLIDSGTSKKALYRVYKASSH